MLELLGIHGMNRNMRGESAKKFEAKLRIIMAEKRWGRPKLKKFIRGKMSPHTVDTLLNHKRMGEDLRDVLACSLPDMNFKSAADLLNYQQPSTAPAEREGNVELMPTEEFIKLRERVAVLEHRIEQLEKAGFHPQFGVAGNTER